MAEFQVVETFTLEAAADLSACQFHAVRLSAQNKCNVASDPAASSIVGILINKPKLTPSPEFGTIAFFGKTRLVAGGAITAGTLLQCNSSGRAAAVASGNMAFGRALDTSTTDGDVISALIFPPVRWAGAV